MQELTAITTSGAEPVRRSRRRRWALASIAVLIGAPLAILTWGAITAPSAGDSWLHVWTGLVFVDDDHGYAVSRRGQVLATEDGGRSWRSLPTTDVEFSDLSATEALAIASTYDGRVVAVDARGGHRVLLSTDDTSYLAIAGSTDGRIVVAGDPGRLAVSADSGATWTNATHPAPQVDDVAWGSDGTIWILSRSSGLYRSKDLGRSWSPVADFQSAGRVAATDQALAVVGALGLVSSSPDQGTSWTGERVAFPPWAIMGTTWSCVDLEEPMTVIGSATGELALSDADGWRQVDLQSSEPYSAVRLVGPSRAVALRDDGALVEIDTRSGSARIVHAPAR